MHDGAAGAGPEAAPDLAAGAHQGGAAIEGDQEREDPGDADVPGQLGHVPHPGQLHRGLPGAPAEAGLALLGMGELRLRGLSGAVRNISVLDRYINSDWVPPSHIVVC